tara:strand:- start:63 stop:1052 length:990 start_codon:yes stop_codon:yes gene_type:complete
MRTKIDLRNSKYFLICTSYSLIITFLTNILGYQDSEILIRPRYLAFFEGLNSYFIHNLETESLFFTLVNDALFFIICYLLGLFLNPYTGLRLLIFISSFITSNIILRNKNSNFFFSILFLVNPILILSLITDIRQSFAMAIFLISFNLVNKVKRRIGFFIASTIHTGYFLISFFYFFSQFLIRVKSNLYNKTLIFAGSYSIFTLSFFSIASLIPARQVGIYLESVEDYAVSGLSFVLWLFILIMFVLKDEKDLNQNQIYIFSISIIIFYLASYYFLPFSMRVFEACLPLIFISTNYLSKLPRQIIVLLISMQGLYVYFFSWKESLLAIK